MFSTRKGPHESNTPTVGSPKGHVSTILKNENGLATNSASGRSARRARLAALARPAAYFVLSSELGRFKSHPDDRSFQQMKHSSVSVENTNSCPKPRTLSLTESQTPTEFSTEVLDVARRPLRRRARPTLRRRAPAPARVEAHVSFFVSFFFLFLFSPFFPSSCYSFIFFFISFLFLFSTVAAVRAMNWTNRRAVAVAAAAATRAARPGTAAPPTPSTTQT